MLRVAVCVSGGGTNLQAIIDAAAAGTITNTELALVISNKPGAYALERAKKAGISSEVLVPKDYEDRNAFGEALIRCLNDKQIDLVVLAGYLVILPENFETEQEEADKLVTYKASGYGLKNVNDRMQLLYGMEYGIKVFSQIDQGTRVEMRIPREKADEEAVAAGEFSTKKFLQEPEEDTEDTTGKKGGKSEEKK